MAIFLNFRFVLSLCNSSSGVIWASTFTLQSSSGVIWADRPRLLHYEVGISSTCILLLMYSQDGATYLH